MQPGDAQQITQKKKMFGCLVALIVCGVVGGLMCICTGVGLAVFATSEDGQKFAEAVSRSQAEMENAGKRPGVKELVAAGCPAASVMDTSDHRIFAELFLDAGPAEKADDYLWVQCWGARGYRGTLPTCEALALCMRRRLLLRATS